ncbi:MAG: ribonuclease E/G, partial [Pseudanabaena sp. M57BS1SP1A06MG]|nr:ribonuclease E/G [Pseudanabaena sp. M57BS1SP1A06MG]
TEALTVIDVNSGSFTKSQTSRETVLWTNCEAAVEIARQIRLRNIAGVIVVDFIDMDTRRDQLQLLEYFNKALRADKSRPQIAQLTELGLVELTRKRQGQSIYELFGRPCSTCGGLGHLMHLPGEVAGQPVDSTSRTWESKQSNQLDFTSEYEDGDSELGGGLEPNLVNHPSYQERGNLRRRSKRTLLNKDSRDLRELEKVAPVDVRSRVESRFEPRFEPRVDREIVERAIPSKIALPSISPTKHIAEPVEELVEIVEPAPIIAAPEVSIPERPNKRELRTKVVEPPEVIVVEMTEEEQDVYSLIGVSPLVLVDREVKDPRNVIVTVALPGQAPKNAIKPSPAVLNASIAEDVIEPETAEEIDSEVAVNELPIVTTNNGITNPNGVILKVNRAQPSEPIDDEANNSKNDFLDSSKEFVPIQSPEASRRKRSSASQ